MTELDELKAATRMLQFASQALPTGAFAYSGGLESVVALGFVESESQGLEFLETLLRGPLCRVDLPLFLRMYDALADGDFQKAGQVSAYLLANRETGELQAQDRQMARALRRVLAELLGENMPDEFAPSTFSEALALACVVYQIPRKQASLLCAFTWMEQHTTALARLLPLGPLASQRVVDAMARSIPDVVLEALGMSDAAVGLSAPGLGVLSSLHETQYTRVFRS